MMTGISGYHAHVYYDESSLAIAEMVCREATSQDFDITMGRMHQAPVGPHPHWSCQLSFTPEAFSEVVPWLATHRQGLTVFIHPETGDVIKDHIEHAMWMGKIEVLDIAFLERMLES